MTDSVSDDEERQEYLSVVEQGGVSIVHLAADSLHDDHWLSVRVQLRCLLFESPQGLVVDCRELSGGSSALLAPLLYELLLAGRQRQPRIDVSVVGNQQQTIGDGSVFLLPPRFETVEAATANVQRRLGAQGGRR